MIGGLSKVVMDVAPFSICDGHPAKFCGMNVIGLRRAGFNSTRMAPLKSALRSLLGARLNMAKALPNVKKQFSGNKDVANLLEFIQNSKRGVARA